MARRFKRGGHSQVTHETIEEVTIGGFEVTIEFQRRSVWTHDPAYGADADGRRGMAVDFLDEDEAIDGSVVVRFADTGAVLDGPASLAEADRIVAEWMKANQAEPEGGDEEGDDCDRRYEEWRDRQLERDDDRGDW